MTDDEKLELIAAKKSLSGMRAYFNRLERENVARFRQIVKLQEEEIAILKKRAGMSDAFKDDRKPKKIKVAYKKKKNPRAYQLHLSDTHSREIVHKAETNGRNEHNPDIGRERIRSIIMQTVQCIKDDSRNHDPVHLTVWAGGDWMVNADLHYKMERSVDVEPLVEMRLNYEMLKEELGILWSAVPVKSLSFVGSFSNHGRDSKDMQPGLEAQRSYDTEIYRRLEGDFPNVKFNIAETNWTVEDVGGFRTMYTHGHARGCAPKRNNMNVMVPNWSFLQQQRRIYDFDAFVHGHLHSTTVVRSPDFAYMSNGSLVGENGYSNTGGYPPEPAAQNLAIVDLDNQMVERVVTLAA
jgi:predicted phosphodiesterase